jgi:hypothetical protein
MSLTTEPHVDPDPVAVAILWQERRRCVGVVLAEYAKQRALQNREVADVLDALATRLEHPASEAGGA